MTAIIALLAALNGYKTYIAAAILGLLAANAALESAGIVFLPVAVVTALTWLAGALGLAGVRHALAKTEAAAGRSTWLPLLLLGLLLPAIGCTVQVKHEYPPEPAKGCKCCIDCKCGQACDCKSGNKCCIACDCRKLKGFELSKLPTAPPDMYCVLNDGARNGWWLDGGRWGWWHDGQQTGIYSPSTGQWQRYQRGTTYDSKPAPVAISYAEPAPWVAKVPTGMDQSKLTSSGERLLISGEPK